MKLKKEKENKYSEKQSCSSKSTNLILRAMAMINQQWTIGGEEEVQRDNGDVGRMTPPRKSEKGSPLHLSMFLIRITYSDIIVERHPTHTSTLPFDYDFMVSIERV